MPEKNACISKKEYLSSLNLECIYHYWVFKITSLIPNRRQTVYISFTVSFTNVNVYII